MGVGRGFRKKPLRRPKKTGTDRRRRQALHRKKLVALGGDPAVIKHLTPGEVRSELNKRQRVAGKKTKKA